MANGSYRLMYRFWLNVAKPDEEEIADKIELLKNERSFTSAIRDGIRLIWDLRQGNTAVLFELFPWLQERLQVSSVNQGREELLREQIERLEQLILQQGNPPDAPVMKPAGNGLRPIGGAQSIPDPQFEDDEDMMLEVSRATGDGNSTQNFLRSMMALQQ